jgi:hypothetical protein
MPFHNLFGGRDSEINDRIVRQAVQRRKARRVSGNKRWGEAPALPQGPRKAILVPKPSNGQRRTAAEPDPAHAIVP